MGVFIWSMLIFVLHLHRFSIAQECPSSGDETEVTEVTLEGISNRTYSSNENTTIRYRCLVSTNSSAPWNITWYFQRLGETERFLIEQYDESLDATTTIESVTTASMTTDHTVPLYTSGIDGNSSASFRSIKERYLLLENENLTIFIAANDNYTWHRVDGKYICVVSLETKCTKYKYTRSVIISPAEKDKNVATESTAETVVQDETTAPTTDFTTSPLSIFSTYNKQIDDLRNATGLNSSEKIMNIARSMSDKTNYPNLTSEELIGSIDTVEKLAQLRKENDKIPIKRDEINHVMQTMSNILQPINAHAWSKTNSTMATKLLTSADIYGSCLCRTTNETQPTIEDAQNIALKSYCGFNLSSDISFWEETGDRISIDKTTLNETLQKENSSLNIWSLYFRNINNYIPNTGNFLLNSRVLSLSTSEPKLTPSFEITFQHTERRSRRDRLCVYWKTDSSGGGDWSDEGCKVVTSDAHKTVCSCQHLTNFAVLMSRKPSEDKALSLVSDILCTLSVASLVLTIVIHAVTWKHSKSHQNVLLLNLCVALIVAYFVFLVGSVISSRKKSENNPVNAGNETNSTISKLVGDDCKVVAVLLHYFFLAAFFMMLAEGIQLFIYVVFVFHAKRTKETALLIVTAWVLPMIIVAVSISVTKAEGHGARDLGCWLSEELMTWAFVVPALTIVAINSVIIVIVFVKVSRSRIASSKNDRRTKIRKMLWNVSVLCPVLGITWLFGVLTMIDEHVVLQYIFAIANSAQGIFIFVFHALFINEKFNEGLSSFCHQCIGSKKSDKERILAKKPTAKKTTKKAKPLALDLGMANNYSSGQELDNAGFSYSSERLPSLSGSSEKSPNSATIDTSLVSSPTSDTIDVSYL